MAYSQSNFTTNLWPLLMPEQKNRSSSEQADLWTYRFEVPSETFTAEWITNNVPPRGGACPTEMASTGDAVLHRHFAYYDVAGSVIVVLTCGWGGYIAGDIPASNATLDKYFVSSPEDVHAAYYASQQWILRFEIPIAIYTTAWVSSNLPDAGDSPSAAMKALVDPAVDGTLLHRRVGYYVRPNYVGITLVYGWRSTYFDSLTRVSSRLVTIHRKRTRNSSGTLITGPVLTSATTRETQRYVLDDEDEEATYTQITITSIVSSIPDAWKSANRNKRNSDEVTIRGVTFGVGQVLYVGGASEDIQASQSPTGSAALRMTLVLLAGAHAWPLTTDRYIETLTRVKVNVMEGDVKKGDGTATRWVKAAARTDEQTIRTEFAMGAAITALP